jgi:hypothetical protein
MLLGSILFLGSFDGFVVVSTQLEDLIAVVLDASHHRLGRSYHLKELGGDSFSHEVVCLNAIAVDDFILRLVFNGITCFAKLRSIDNVRGGDL